MASAQEPCTVEIVLTDTKGGKHTLAKGDVVEFGPGGSADGVIASTATYDVRKMFPFNPMRIEAGSVIEIFVTLYGTDGIDWSDCGVSLPYRRADGSTGRFVNADFTGADIASCTGGPHRLAYLNVAFPFYFGGDKGFLSVEDDTA